MKKGGQIFIFIIIAIALIAAVAVYFFAVRSPENSSTDIVPIQSFITDCIGQTTREAVYIIGQSGGYVTLPEKSTANAIAIYFDKGTVLMPSRETMEHELNTFVNEALLFCTQHFYSFEDVEVEEGEITTRGIIKESTIDFNVHYPLAIKKGTQMHHLENFEMSIESNLFHIHAFLEEYMKEQTTYTDSLCIGCLARIAQTYNLQTEILDYDAETVIIGVVDPYLEINDEPYRFYIALRF
ncbi:MAG: hypothetical protein RL557_963 [archaeon]|jgi:hypothetical protein